MTNKIGEMEAALVFRKAQEIGKARDALLEPKYPRLINGLATGLGCGLVIYAMDSVQASLLFKVIFSGTSVGLLGVLVEQWSIRKRLEASIQLLLSHDERLNLQNRMNSHGETAE
ncbi:hypothetical protein [Rubrivivax gelatinosus]|uniref:Uncharacterized protein n=1 Tax=Rubrivivax gelatinosus (strain NBRC 100245 / IL144) TaxID=983917 RepID=I0HX79_RUBGI|nr:hypothetical protein [Rubrivivax gelatinosus]BAL97616.1 hypothetical protein RGE_42800 [Rubrivivax gelatinosus IL144]